MLAALPPVFAGLTPTDSQEAASMLRAVEVEPGGAIMLEGEEDTTAAWIVTGSAEIWKGDVKVGRGASRDMLGEVELFAQIPRVCSVTAANQVTLHVLEPEAYQELCSRGNPVVYAMERAAIRRIGTQLRALNEGITERTQGVSFELHPVGPSLVQRLTAPFRREKVPDLDPAEVLGQSELFSWVPGHHLQDIGEHFEVEKFPAEHILCRQGEDGDKMWLIASGEVEVVLLIGDDRAHTVATLKAGQAFGDTAMALNSPRSATCVSRDEVVALSMNRQKFQELHDSDEAGGSAFRQGIIRNLILQLLATMDRFVVLERRTVAHEQQRAMGTPVGPNWR